MSPSVSARLLGTQSDARLVAFARAGHERAFEALVRRYRGPLLGYCRRLLLSEERAEDALQQALMQAWLALRAGTEVQNAKAWLYRIVHNSALNALRVSGYDFCTLSESLSGADAPQEDLDRRIAVREALAGLAALPEMQREALLRTAVEGSSHRETARELGVSEPALRGLVYRARAALRAAAGAIVPPPLVGWALESGGGGGPVGERLVELGAGGSAGVAGLLMKGGAAAVTAGVLASGIAAVHAHPRHVDGHHHHPASGDARRHALVKTAPVALASLRSRMSFTPVADVRAAPVHAKSLSAHRSKPGVEHLGRHRHRGWVHVEMAPALGMMRAHPRVGDDRADPSGRGGHGDHGSRRPRAHDRGSGADAEGGGDGRHDGGHGAMSGERSGRSDGEHSSSGDGASGISSTGGGGRRDRGGGEDESGRGEQTDETSRSGESRDKQGPTRASSTTASGASEDEQNSEADGKRD
jgi:RNA polymerase sigma factor (sigma-70 family)